MIVTGCMPLFESMLPDRYNSLSICSQDVACTVLRATSQSMYYCTQAVPIHTCICNANAVRDTVICPTAAAQRTAAIDYLTLPDLQKQHLAGRGYAALGRLIAPIWLAHSAG